ncbi:MAG: hydroxymethylbilane synthase [Anaerolineales bacterium]
MATRPSTLARRQTEAVARDLQKAWPHITTCLVVITTEGDRVTDRPLPEIGGKGLFTQELETALLAGQVDLAVHSLKDLPIEDRPGLKLGAILPRQDARDVLISRKAASLEDLAPGSAVGTSSLRRQAQLLALRPDVRARPMRGNVETRIRKVLHEDYDAAILAAAGVIRLGLEMHIASWLPFEVMLPAPGQGALAVQCRSEDRTVLQMLAALDDPATRAVVTSERAFLEALGGGCSAPVGAHASPEGQGFRLRGVVASLDGREVVRVGGYGTDPAQLGRELAEEALRKGAAVLVQSV